MNVLVTSISKKVPMLKAVRGAMEKSVGEGRLFGADLDAACVGSYFVDQLWRCPPLKDLEPNAIVDYCKRNGISVIFPSRDGELVFFAQHRKLLAESGIDVMVSDLSAVELSIDKLLFARQLTSEGFPAIPTYASISFEAPLYVVKERYGAGSERVGIGLDRQAAERFAAQLTHPVFQPYVPGAECSVDLYVDARGRAKGVILRERRLVIQGESQVTKTFSDARLEQLAIAFAERYRFRGHIMLQLIIDGRNQPHIIECNCRFGGASTLAIAAGLDSFYWFMEESRGKPSDELIFHRQPQDLTLIRHAEDLIQ